MDEKQVRYRRLQLGRGCSESPIRHKMWAFLVLALALTAGASDTHRDTAAEEKPFIARGKLLVRTERNPPNIGINLYISLGFLSRPCDVLRLCDIVAGTGKLQKSEVDCSHVERMGGSG